MEEWEEFGFDSEEEMDEFDAEEDKNGGCYIATSVYGSYDCPPVWTLRRFRDYKLANSWYGRLFIRIYYWLSPTLVKLCGHMNWFQKLGRKYLDRMVSKLIDNGYSSEPYNDRKH